MRYGLHYSGIFINKFKTRLENLNRERPSVVDIILMAMTCAQFYKSFNYKLKNKLHF